MIKKRQYLTIAKANILFFVLATVTLFGSAFFQPKLGTGTNLWINEFVYILIPPLLLAKFNGWSLEGTYRLKGTSNRNKIISILSGISMWLFAAYISTITRIFLDDKLGVLANPEQGNPSVYQSFLLIIGMIVLAPICEEIFFRGFMQRAYEGHNKKFGFIITAFIFGSYHVLNGISEVIPACILGLGMGYLMYKTNSILSSMLFHAAANFCAVFVGGSIDTFANETIPVWLHIIAFIGVFISVFLLRSIKDQNQDEEGNGETYEESRLTATGIVFLILSAIFIIVIGAIEVLTR